MVDKDGSKIPSRARITLLAASRFGLGFLVLGILLFGSSGDLAWRGAWRYLGVIAGIMALVAAYLLAFDPELLEKRMRTREARGPQKRCVAASSLVILPLFALPGLDRRFAWSSLPEAAQWAGLALVVAGFALFFSVVRTNSYASRVIEVQAGQKVIDTGPYSALRHPMYAATILIYFGSPLALASFWALVPAAAYLPLLVLRILDEEAMLRRDLPGYEEYCRRVRFRLVPGLW